MGPPAGQVACALLRFGDDLRRAGTIQVGSSFTRDPEADAFVRRDSNAFLIGVLFTQGIPADRAWAAPHLLRQRLGHFDMERMTAGPDAVRDAIAQPPALHRFVKTLPVWVVAAAGRLVAEYDGDAGRIWPPGTEAAALRDRLMAFCGIGRKKAAMAVELLSRHLGVEVDAMHGGSVAYDIHVRRVFLRSGLVETDSAEAVESAARTHSPEDPGLLDLPTWVVGRTWCRPVEPRCAQCALGATCMRRVDRSPRSVGERPSGPAPSRAT